MALAFLPEIAAAAVALFAVKTSGRLRTPLPRRNNCEGAAEKAVVWSYQPSGNGPGSSNQAAWRPVVRQGSC